MTSLPPSLARLVKALALTIGITALAIAGTIKFGKHNRNTAAPKAGDVVVRSNHAPQQHLPPAVASTTHFRSLLNPNSLLTETKLSASDGAPGNRFGSAVAVSGNTAAIGDISSVYVFVRSNGTWAQQQKLSPVSHQYIAIDGDTLVAAGANYFHVFVRNAAMWNSQQVIDIGNATFSVAISGDTIVVGIPWDREGCPAASFGNRGAALVFVRNNGVWTQQQRLTASDGQCGGEPSGIIIDGETPYVHPGDYFGTSVSISHDTILAGAYTASMGPNVQAGAAYIFVRNGGSWIQQQKLQPANLSPLSSFGVAVAISNDTAVVGAIGDNGALVSPDQPGSAFVFGRSDGTWTLQQSFPAGIAPNCAYSFGGSVAVDGDSIVVGCNTDQSPADPFGPPRPLGSASWFKRNGSSWIQQPRLTAGDGVLGDSFAHTVAIAGPTIVVGAYRDDTLGGTDAGSAYVFQDGDIDTTPPSLIVPSTIEVEVTSSAGAVVNYSVSASDNRDPNPTVECGPLSGSVFPIGTTLVNCTATDASNNSASDSFTVNVAQGTPPPPPSCTPDPNPIPLPLPALPDGGLRRALVMGQSQDSSGYGHFLYVPSGEVVDKNPCKNIAGGKDCPKPNVQIVKESGSTWVRLWADWPTYQPADPPQPPGNLFPNIVDVENTCATNYIDRDRRTHELITNLDEQIMTARREGLRVILTTNRFPVWATYPKSLFSSNQLFVVPDDVGVDSPWGKWVKFLVKRYG